MVTGRDRPVWKMNTTAVAICLSLEATITVWLIFQARELHSIEEPYIYVYSLYYAIR